MPNYNKKELAILKQAEQKYMEANQLEKIKRTPGLTKEIIMLAHDRYELITTPAEHNIMRAISKKCGKPMESPEDKVIREDIEVKVKRKRAKKDMKAAIKKKYEEEMKKEMEYYGVIEGKKTSIEEPVSKVEVFFDTGGDLDEADEKVKKAIEKELAEEGKELKEEIKDAKLDIEDILDSL